MPRALLPHGTNAAYVRHRQAGEASCPACLSAHSAYSVFQAGHLPRVDAAPIARAAGVLIAEIGLRATSRQTGVGKATLWRLVTQRQATTRAAIAARIMAARPRHIACHVCGRLARDHRVSESCRPTRAAAYL